MLGLILISNFTQSSEIIKIKHIVREEMALEEIIGIYLKPDRQLDKNSEGIKQTISSNEIKPRYFPNDTLIIYLKKDDIKDKFLSKKTTKKINNDRLENYASVGSGIRTYKKQTATFGITQKNYTPLILEVGLYDFFASDIYLNARTSFVYKATNPEYLVEDKNRVEGSLSSGYLLNSKPLGFGLYLQSESAPMKTKRYLSQKNELGYGLNVFYGVSGEFSRIIRLRTNLNYFKLETSWPLMVDINLSTPVYNCIDLGVGISKSFLSDEYQVDRISINLQYLF